MLLSDCSFFAYTRELQRTQQELVCGRFLELAQCTVTVKKEAFPGDGELVENLKMRSCVRKRPNIDFQLC